MQRLILRPLLVFLTLLMLVVALFQVSGRLLFWFLDDLEPLANQWLQGQRATLSGLSGDWRLLNPIIRVARLDVPAGHVTGIYIEIDWVESLMRNMVVAQRLTIEESHLTLERTPDGWRLKDAAEPIEFDVSNLLYHSDELDLNARIGLLREPLEGDGSGAVGGGRAVAVQEELIDLRYRGVNRGGRHRHRVVLENPQQSCADDCAFQLGVDTDEKIWFVRPQTRTVNVAGDGFVVPRALLGTGSLRLDAFQARWQTRESISGGALSLSFSEFELQPGRKIGGGLRLHASGDESGQHGRLDDLHFRDVDDRLEMAPVLLGFEDDVLQWWTEQLDLGAALGFLARQVQPGSPAGLWLNALDLQADARNVRGFFRVEDSELGYAATIGNLSMNAFAGAPALRDAGGELLGHSGGMQILLNAEDMYTYFPGFFPGPWSLNYAQGILQAWFSRDHFAMRGRNMRLSAGESLASGGFALTRPRGLPLENRLALMVHVDRSTVANVMRYVPVQLPSGLPEWLETGPRAGELTELTLAYQGQLKVQPFEVGARRVELQTRIDEGHVEYHPDWPDLLNLNGQVAVAGNEVSIQIDHGQSEEGARLDGSRVVLGDNAAYADVAISTETELADALGFVRRSPLADWLSFITPSWAGSGKISLDGTMHIPLRLQAEHIGESSLEEELAINLQVGLSEVDLQLPEYRVELGRLSGVMSYEYPNDIRANGVRGEIFDRPALFGAESDDDTVVFHVSGQAPYGDVLELLDMSDPGIMRGGFDFLADLHVELTDAVPSRLEVVSDLTGLALDLPGEFAKGADDAVDTDLVVRFLQDYEDVRFRYLTATGWLHVDDVPLRGGVGFSTPAPGITEVADELLLIGEVARFSLEEVIPDAEGGLNFGLPIRLDDLRASTLSLEELQFTDLIFAGTVTADSLALRVDSQYLQGTIDYEGDEPLRLHLTRLMLPSSESTEDPLDPAIIADLPHAQVLLDQFTVGDEDYGSWSFELVPDEQGVAMRDLDASLRGVAISAPDGVYWQQEPNETRFTGKLLAQDLAKVLPQWGFAPTVTTETATVEGTLRWRGSPGNVEVERLMGQAEFAARNGRFVEVDAGGQGAMRIFSLVNITTIFKRLTLDFSDLSGEGITFNKIAATAQFDEGLLTFVEPMIIEGSGSNFKIAGQVDLVAGTLDNEMIVTLPVTRGLPWYSIYIALASPITAIGVVVGEQILRRPIEQFSSAKYHVSGPIDDPELTFLNVWDTSVDKPKTALEAVPEEVPAAEDPQPPTASKES